MKLGRYFLPYQSAWILDESRLKICEKSRRIGMTYVQSYEDVRDACRRENPMDVWFSSADESAAREYIRYCEQWTRLLKIAAESFTHEIVIENEGNLKTFSIEFATGKRINALSSNPKAFRSKGGKLVLDEFAFHQDQESMWKAARPIITWGYPCRILSTYKGKSNRYYRMVDEAKRGNDWSLHSTTITQAVEQGLADRILQRELTPEERENWLEQERQTCGDEETWLQEYCCIPVDEATAWLTWDLIAGCEHPDAGKPELYDAHPCYVGMDIGRRRDLTVIWVLEKLGDVLWTREVICLKKVSFAAQEAELDRVMNRYRVLKLCMDQTGMGEQPTERAKNHYGSCRVEGVIFNNANKQALAQGIKEKFEDRSLRIPSEKHIREAHHAIKKSYTATGNPRFDGDSETGHADEFWAHALAIQAASTGGYKIEFQSTGIKTIRSKLGGFYR